MNLPGAGVRGWGAEQRKLKKSRGCLMCVLKDESVLDRGGSRGLPGGGQVCTKALTPDGPGVLEKWGKVECSSNKE